MCKAQRPPYLLECQSYAHTHTHAEKVKLNSRTAENLHIRLHLSFNLNLSELNMLQKQRKEKHTHTSNAVPFFLFMGFAVVVWLLSSHFGSLFSSLCISLFIGNPHGNRRAAFTWSERETEWVSERKRIEKRRTQPSKSSQADQTKEEKKTFKYTERVSECRERSRQ